MDHRCWPRPFTLFSLIFYHHIPYSWRYVNATDILYMRSWNRNVQGLSGNQMHTRPWWSIQLLLTISHQTLDNRWYFWEWRNGFANSLTVPCHAMPVHKIIQKNKKNKRKNILAYAYTNYTQWKRHATEEPMPNNGRKNKRQYAKEWFLSCCSLNFYSVPSIHRLVLFLLYCCNIFIEHKFVFISYCTKNISIR